MIECSFDFSFNIPPENSQYVGVWVEWCEELFGEPYICITDIYGNDPRASCLYGQPDEYYENLRWMVVDRKFYFKNQDDLLLFELTWKGTDVR